MRHVLIVGILCLSSSGIAQLLQPGEELEYDVSYLGISLGRIRIVTNGPEELSGKPAVKVAAYMQSHPNIPFLSLQAVFQSWLDTSAAFSYRFQGRVRQGNEPEGYGSYEFDYDQRLLRGEEWEGERL
ncbi:MAG: DUF3108 domain-containing protein, partial [Candidatus Kapabacteria bacterium]|nr:DUF3108 domain-containing protein [Candidatus Kapabacteria bacterium]MDW7997480.1 hypothetical protein [Bacteroidota bacterium]